MQCLTTSARDQDTCRAEARGAMPCHLLFPCQATSDRQAGRKLLEIVKPQRMLVQVKLGSGRFSLVNMWFQDRTTLIWKKPAPVGSQASPAECSPRAQTSTGSRVDQRVAGAGAQSLADLFSFSLPCTLRDWCVWHIRLPFLPRFDFVSSSWVMTSPLAP